MKLGSDAKIASEPFPFSASPSKHMPKLSTRMAVRSGCLALFLVLCVSAQAQNLSFNYLYKFEAAMITQPPQLGELDIEYPDAARKNGVEGTARVSFTLGEDGKVRDIVIINDLPSGVGEAVRAGVQKMTFKPASFDGKPAAIKVTLEYVVSVVYDEFDKTINKPKITDKPFPPHPPNHAGVKGKVYVGVLLLSNGEVKVGGVSSTMPKEFDEAVLEAAKLIKFSPATHKKSKQPVSQKMTVEYDFKL